MTRSDLESALLGSWQTVHGAARRSDGRTVFEVVDGLFTLGPDEQAHALVTCDDRDDEGNLIETMGSCAGYYGRWSVDPETRSLHIEVRDSTVSAWRGRRFTRGIELRDAGRTLELTVIFDAQSTDDLDFSDTRGSVVWRRLGA